MLLDGCPPLARSTHFAKHTMSTTRHHFALCLGYRSLHSYFKKLTLRTSSSSVPLVCVKEFDGSGSTYSPLTTPSMFRLKFVCLAE